MNDLPDDVRVEPIPTGDDLNEVIERLRRAGFVEVVGYRPDPARDGAMSIPVFALGQEGYRALLDLLAMMARAVDISMTPEEKALSAVAADLINKLGQAARAENVRRARGG